MVTETRRLTLAGILELADAGDDRWFAPTPAAGHRRLFGGQVAAQALAAASRTVRSERVPHSLHGYFIRGGRPCSTLELVVERTRDGRSFSTRHVTAFQEGKAIFNMTASFHHSEEGFDWQLPTTALAQPAESDLGSPQSRPPFWELSPFLVLPVELGRAHPCWVRLVESFPNEPGLQACALTFASDFAVALSARAPHNNASTSMASLDHAVWFHRPINMNEWHLFRADPVSNSNARGLAFGSFHSVDGTRVASIAQEGLFRPN